METDQLVSQQGQTLFGITLDGFSVFLAILALIIVVAIVSELISTVSRIITDSYQDYFKNDIQLSLFAHMERMEVWRTMNSRFRNISRLLDDNFISFADQIITLPGNIIRRSIEIVGITAVFAYFDIRLLVVVFISSLCSYGISTYSDRISKKYDIAWDMSLGQKVYHYSSLFYREFIHLATNGAVRSTLDNYRHLLDAQVHNGLQKNWSQLIWSLSSLFTDNMSNLLIKWIVGYGVFIGTSSVGMVALVVSSMGTVSRIMSSLIGASQDYRTFRFRESSILLFLQMCEPINSGEWAPLITAPIEQLSAKRVSFRYPNLAEYEREYMTLCQRHLATRSIGANDWLNKRMQELIDSIEEDSKREYPLILDDISITLNRWSIYGIVGKNGAGKTTLMHLISGFFRWYEWQILFNRDETRNWESAIFSKRISFLTQVPYIMDWQTTLRENLLLWADTSIADEVIWGYLNKFGLGDKVRKVKNQLDADMGDDIEFSGGEKQIIAFIRVLLQDRDIVIMDEWTNQLDAENEILVMQELIEKKANKIIIFITHRMSTISRSDMIYCLEWGSISASGSHRDLLSRDDNAYARFYRVQVLHDGVI